MTTHLPPHPPALTLPDARAHDARVPTIREPHLPAVPARAVAPPHTVRHSPPTPSGPHTAYHARAAPPPAPHAAAYEASPPPAPHAYEPHERAKPPIVYSQRM